jgi:Tfp pilus assembly protein PilV
MRQPVRDDSGFSLIEAVVALFVAAVAFTALAAASLSAVKGSMTARQNQQAADFMARELEAARLLDFGSLANVASDLAGDPDISTCAGKPCIDPGTGTKEPIYTGATGSGGGVNPHIKTVTGGTANNSTFLVKTYVTTPSDAYGSDYRRVSVTAEWNAYGKHRERTISSIVAFSQRGLPLPVFKITPLGSTTQDVNPGVEVVYGFRVTNQGAPDRFNLTENTPAAGWTWVYDDGDGVWNKALDTGTIADTNGDSVRDTGRLNPNGYKIFWAYYTPTAVGTVLTTWSATSVAQAAATGGTQTVLTTTKVATGVITPTPTTTSTPPTPATDCGPASPPPTATAASGYTTKSYTLHNSTTPGNTTAGTLLSMNTSSPYASLLYQYSTDVATANPGRVLTTGGTFASGSNAQRLDWRYPVGKKAYSGTATMTLWVASPVGSPITSVGLTAYVYTWKKTGSSYAAASVATIPLTISPFSCTGFQRVDGASATFTVPQLGQNDEIGVRVVNTGTSAVRVAYDVVSVYPSALVLPEK